MPGRAQQGGATGTWEVAGARIELREEEGAVVGRLAREGGPCDVP